MKKTNLSCKISKLKKLALQTHKNHNNIIITKADDGSMTGILNVEDYIAEAQCQLNDTTCYGKLDNDPTPTYNMINNASDNKLPKKMAQSLKTEKPKTPKFYTLPKIHNFLDTLIYKDEKLLNSTVSLQKEPAFFTTNQDTCLQLRQASSITKLYGSKQFVQKNRK